MNHRTLAVFYKLAIIEIIFFKCNTSFSYISLLFSHTYFVLFQQFLSSESSDSLIIFGPSEVLISKILSYFFCSI